MKKYIFLFVLFLAALASCTSELENIFTAGEVTTIHVSAQEFQAITRTSIDKSNHTVKWSEGDIIGIFPMVEESSQIAFKIMNGSGTGSSASFDGKGWGLKNGTSYSAYYPLADKATLEKTNITLDYSGQIQTGNGNTDHLGAYDFMYAESTSPVNGSLDFQFQHVGTLVQLSITVPDGNYDKLELHSDNCFYTKAVLDLNTGNTIPDEDSKTNKLTLSLKNVNVTEGKLEIYTMAYPVDFENSDILAYVYDENGKIYSSTYKGTSFKPGLIWDGTEELTLIPSLTVKSNHIYEMHPLVEYPYVDDYYWYGNVLAKDLSGRTSEYFPYVLPMGQIVSYYSDSPYQINAKGEVVRDEMGNAIPAPFYYNPVAYLSCYLNPSSAVAYVETLSLENKLITNTTRAVAGTPTPQNAAATIVESSFQDSIITVGYTANGHNISNQSLSSQSYNSKGQIVSPYGSETLNLIALKADVKNGSIATTVTSDYAVLYPSVITFENIAYAKGKAATTLNCEGLARPETHIYETAVQAIESAPTIQVEYNGSIDLSAYMTVHYNQTNAPLTDTETAGYHKIIKYSDVTKYNLEWKFYMTSYYVGSQSDYASNTNESSYGKLNGSIFTPQYIDENGNLMTSNGTTGLSSAGKRPLIRVELIDKTTGNVVLAGFIKVGIIATVASN